MRFLVKILKPEAAMLTKNGQNFLAKSIKV